MHPVGSARKRNIDAIVDQKRNCETGERRLYLSRPFHQEASWASLIAKLDERGAPLRQQPRKLDEMVAARVLGIDERIEAKIERHYRTRARASRVSRSRLASASRISTDRVPGPRARAPAHSPATAKANKAADVASQQSASTARQAPISAVPAQPIAVTRP